MAIINGDRGNNNLIGTPESDTIFGDLGDDILDGLGGDDEFVFNNVINFFFLQYGLDNDMYVFSTDGFDIIKKFRFLEDRVISIDPQTKTPKHLPIEVNGVAPNRETLSSGKFEYIYGTTGADIINGTSADDTIYGFDGKDILYGNDGTNILYGGSGDDSLYGGAYTDFLYGGLGNDYLSGGDHNNNKLYGEEGNDTLDGSGEVLDTLVGGTGDDTYIVFLAISGFENMVNSLTDNVIENFNEGTDTVVSFNNYMLGDNLENLILTGSNNINGVGNALDNLIDGNAGHNFLAGGNGNDYLRGFGNYDILVGEAGNDTLEGGAGDDFLNGGSGSDKLIGDPGNDILTGGTGADKFVFNSKSHGIDIIKDFSREENDKIQISTFGFDATSTSQFSYNSNTGALSFLGTQFATLENKPSFIPSIDIELVSGGLTSSITSYHNP